MGTGSREGQAALEPVRMKETCRICGRELCGARRRWIFHPATRVNLQAVLSHALGRELGREPGGGEFACSKCAFMLERVFRFDTVVARVEALSLSRVHKLLLEKERLRSCIRGLYSRSNSHEEGGVGGPDWDQQRDRDRSRDQEARYLDMVQEDLAYCVYESWADPQGEGKRAGVGGARREEGEELHPQALPPRRCRGCTVLRVADSDYEAVCKVPRRAARRSTSCGPPTHRCSASTTLGGQDPETTPSTPGGEGPETTPTILGGQGPEITVILGDQDPETTSPILGAHKLETTISTRDPKTTAALELPSKLLFGGSSPSPASSVESLDTALDTVDGLPGEGAGLQAELHLLKSCRYRPLRPARTSRLPLPLPAGRRQQAPPRWTSRAAPQQQLQVELQEMEEQWMDDYLQWKPIRCQQRPIRDQLGVCESATLLAKIRDSESRNQELQQRLTHMKLQLQSAQDEAQQHQRDIQNLSNTLSSKEAQAAELSAVIEKQNVSLLSLKQLQVCSAETPSGRSELLDLEVALFQSQLELQAVQRTQRRAERTHGDLRAALQHLEHDLQGALDHRRATERHNRELQQALQKSQALLQERDERLQWCEQAQQQRSEELEAIVRALRASLHSKDQLIQNWELLELEEPQETRDSLLQKLRQRIRERDRALERAVDDRFRCLEGREEEQRQLHLLLRDRERDLERQRCVLANNQETIASLELLLRGRSLELQQVRQGIQQQQQQLEEGGRSCSRGCCALIGQLQEAVQTSAQEAQGLRSALLAAVQPTPSDVLEELRSRLQLKDRLLQEVLSDCARQAQDHQEQVEELQRTISSRDQYIQDSAARLGEVMSEQSARVQELQRQLSFTRGSAGSGGPDQALELQALQEELKLVLRREKENQEIQSRKLQLKEEMILELQRLLVEPSAVPLVEQLSLEVQELRESLVQQGGRRTLEVPNQDQGLDLVQQDLLREPALHQQPELGGPSSQDQDLDPGPGDQDLDENSSQEMTQTHMRKAVLSLQEENRSLKQELSEQREEEQEEELDVTLKGAEETEQEICEQWDTWEGESSLQPEDHKPPSQNQVEQQAAQQVEQQDQGYETCGRSENEAERDDASSPEFDDLEMCTSLDCDPQWWPPPPVTAGGSTPCRSSAPQREPASLQRLVEELRSQLRGSQAVIHGLRSRLRCSAAPPRVSWSHAQEEEQEEQQQQQQQQQDQGLMELLLSRVEALEEQLRSPAADRKSFSLDRKSSGGPGKLDVLIQSQARELSQLRQRQRQARGLSVVLAQQLSDATKAFEELLRSNDVDFLSARSFRQQLAHSAALLERLGARLGTHEDYPEDPEDKTELLAIRLSRELQQKDQVIQSLRSKLNQQQQLDSALSQHSDTPCSSHAPSDITDQSDRISYVSDEHDSVGEEPEVGGIAADCLSRSCYSPEGQSGAQSWISSPSMPCNAEPPRAADGLTGGSSPLSTPFQPLHSFSSVSFQGLHPTPLTPPPPGLLDSSALWDVTYGGRLGAQLGGSLGYQSGTSHTGDLMREHLSEVRMLRQRLEASIITNDRLRLQLQQKVEAEPPFTDRGGATNIYIQGLDSVGQLSAELRILKEEKISLQQQLEETSREGARQVEQMREAVELQHSRLKEAEIQCDRWAEQHKKLQADDAALRQEVALLKQERQKNHEAINRLQHQLTVVPQQLCESRSLVQRELQVHLPHKGGSTASWDLGQLEQQLSGGPPPSRRRLFSDDVPSPPVRDTAPVATEHHRRHLMALQQHIQQGGALLHRMQLNLRSVDPEQDSHLYQLLADAEALRGVLCEADLLFRTSWRDDDDSQQKEAEGSGQGAESLKQEVASLRRKLWQQEQDLGKALEKLRSSDRTKESLEHFVLGQLSRTRDVLKKAKNNLQLRTGEDSSGSATPPPPLLVGVL